MSPRRWRARLKRLEKKIKMIEPAGGDCDFRIDPALAKTLRDDHRRANELEHNYTSSAEWLEGMRLRELNTERARSITCPADYGAKQVRRDDSRLCALSCKRNSPGGFLTNAEDFEEAQLTARIAAYRESAEVRGRNRIFELTMKKFSGLTPEENGEYEHLKTLYPDLPMDPDDPYKEVYDRLVESQLARAKQKSRSDFYRPREVPGGEKPWLE
jgi:hypothetical protein